MQNMKYALLFCHGWALTAATLYPLAEALTPYSDEQQHLQLGYFEPRIVPRCNPGLQWIAIGHSYGFMRVLDELAQQSIKPIAAISLAGFRRFPQPLADVQALHTSLQRRPERTLTHFHHTHDLTSHLAEHHILSLEVLLSDLDDLATREAECATIPLLVLHSAADLLIPNWATQRDFSGNNKNTLHDHADAGHALGLNHVEWCAQKSAEFINELSGTRT
jgi:hypothetical protein